MQNRAKKRTIFTVFCVAVSQYYAFEGFDWTQSGLSGSLENLKDQIESRMSRKFLFREKKPLYLKKFCTVFASTKHHFQNHTTTVFKM